MPGDVLMVHGLAEASVCLQPLAQSLAMRGYEPHFLDYPSTSFPIEHLTEVHLHEAITALRSKETLHIVTHSMGGVMLRYYLQLHGIPNLGRIVMLAPAHAGSPLMTRMQYHPLFPWLMGPAGFQSTDDEKGFALQIPDTISAETGILSGCVSLDPIGSLSMPWPHDGKTTVEGTMLKGMKDHMTLFTSHDMIMFDPQTMYQTAHFLEQGAFHKPWS